MLRVVLELLELPYELLEDDELPPRCCDWPNAVCPEIASAMLSRHVPATISLCIVGSCSTSPAMPGAGVVRALRVGDPHTLPNADSAGLNSWCWKTGLHLPPHLGITHAGYAVDV